MKFATYKDGSRDGQLVVVSRDLTMAHYATGIAGRLQQVLDDWNFLSPQLEELSQTLNHGKARHAFVFDPRSCMAPLPRAYLFASVAPEPTPGRAAALHVRRSDGLQGPCDPLPAHPLAERSGEPAIDGRQPLGSASAELVLITGDLNTDVAADDALAAVHLVTACAIWQHAGDEWGDNPPGSTSFCPVAVTTDELGLPWHKALERLQLQMLINGRHVTTDEANRPRSPDIGQTLARCAARAGLRAGSLIGTGRLISASASAIDGDQVRVAAAGPDGDTLFGAIAASVGAAG